MADCKPYVKLWNVWIQYKELILSDEVWNVTDDFTRT